jgi:tellurite resistance protein
MFLETINESCKKDVLDLALLVAESDDEFSDSEKIIIESYKHEMKIDYNPQKKSLASILRSFANISQFDKKKILFELAALIIADGSYSDEEEHLIKEISAAFNISDDFITQSIEIIDDLNVLYLKASKLVTG